LRLCRSLGKEHSSIMNSYAGRQCAHKVSSTIVLDDGTITPTRRHSPRSSLIHDSCGQNVLRSCGIGARSCTALAIGGRLPHRSCDQTVSNGLLALELALSADGFRFLSRSPVRGFLIEAPAAHLSEYAFALHLLLQDAKRLLDVIVSNEYLHACCSQGSSAQTVEPSRI